MPGRKLEQSGDIAQRRKGAKDCGWELFFSKYLCAFASLREVSVFHPGNGLSRWFCLLLIGILAVVFGWSGLNTIIDPAGFSLSVFRYHLLPYTAVNVVALWIAGLELACVAGLFVPRFRSAALWVILGLLVVFSLGIGINLIRGSHMACGCFSTSPMAHPIGWSSLLKNMGLMVLTIFSLF